ncbi:hypothetical protein Taro_044435 [Colocasia esculenta]|uniref:Uncharacterized protein n=1 Tax=Colocasia esculenta TaxID=4460 RepID=A0A843X0U3_COLES|nr:hypothetical protein [Colocasia esculenta]
MLAAEVWATRMVQLQMFPVEGWKLHFTPMNLRLGRVSSKKHIHISTNSTIPESCSMGGENICI